MGNLFWWGLAIIILLGFSLLYGRGWRRLHQRVPSLITKGRLWCWLIGVSLLALAHLPPLALVSQEWLWGRALQKVLTCLLAPPLLWQACPWHVLAWGGPAAWRRDWTRAVLGYSPIRQWLRLLTNPGLSWLLFISAFLIWHDVGFVNWSMQRVWTHHLALWGLTLAALLYWWHVVNTGPRIHTRRPGWLFFAYLIGADIPNMAAGVTIAFAGYPLYSYYQGAQTMLSTPLNLSTVDDQIIGGGMIWCFGSLVYFSSAILVIRKLFRDNQGDSPQYFPNWDADERMIAPGLEHRLTEKR
jgi:cytochrome c oxidase assembly factor CtaG